MLILFFRRIPSAYRPFTVLWPTGVSKTAGVGAGKAYTIEIISVDSAMIYRGMNIGTAKPTSDDVRCRIT